jgi:hypothetical protein
VVGICFLAWKRCGVFPVVGICPRPADEVTEVESNFLSTCYSKREARNSASVRDLRWLRRGGLAAGLPRAHDGGRRNECRFCLRLVGRSRLTCLGGHRGRRQGVELVAVHYFTWYAMSVKLDATGRECDGYASADGAAVGKRGWRFGVCGEIRASAGVRSGTEGGMQVR